MANDLLEQGRPAEAIVMADEVLASTANPLPALVIKTVASLRVRDFAAALDAAQWSLRLAPHNVSQLINKSLALYALGDCGGSEAVMSQAIATTPDGIEGHVDKGARLLELDRYEEALGAIQQGLLHCSNNLLLLVNQGTALLGLNRCEEALAITAAALQSHAGQPGLLANLALALAGVGRHAEALALSGQGIRAGIFDAGLLTAVAQSLLDKMSIQEAYRALDAIEGSDPAIRATILNCCARQLIEDGRELEAITACQILLEIDGTNAQAHALMGNALARRKRFDEAGEALKRAQYLRRRAATDLTMHDPLPPAARNQHDASGEAEYVAWQMQRLAACDWTDRASFLRDLPALVRCRLDAGHRSPLGAHDALMLPLDGSMLRAISKSLSDWISRTTNSTKLSDSGKSRAGGRPGRLHIGYVSADFRNHATAHLSHQMFRLHDRRRFQVSGYSLAPQDHSAYGRQIAAGCDNFVDVSAMTDSDAAFRIHDDGVDILIDLMGHTHGARTAIFALSPAPVQAGFLGYPGTMGADFLHYIIADRMVLPETLLPFMSEQSVYLPDCYQVNSQHPIADIDFGSYDAGLPEGAFVFCCFNGNRKIEPESFDIWMRLLRRVPYAVLWLFEGSVEAPDNLRREAEKRGVDPQRLVFAPPTEKSYHLARLGLADLFLDTFTYNAHTTASDALWAGVPVLTLCGKTFQSRVAASILAAVGLGEVAVFTAEDYERHALHLATHPTALKELRGRLARNRLTHPLFDTERFVRHLEDAFDAMWMNHASGAGPKPICVAPRNPRTGNVR